MYMALHNLTFSPPPQPKRLKALCDPLHNASMPSTIKGSEDKAHTLVSLSDVTGDATVRVAVALKVLMPLGDVSAVPAAFLAVDREMKCVILSVYHLSEELTKKISEKDVVIVMQPKVKRMEGEGGEGYDGVQVRRGWGGGGVLGMACSVCKTTGSEFAARAKRPVQNALARSSQSTAFLLETHTHSRCRWEIPRPCSSTARCRRCGSSRRQQSDAKRLAW